MGPVRSARTTDPKILVQYSDDPLLAYSGGQPQGRQPLNEAGVVSLTETTANDGVRRDESRSAPHNLFVTTKKLYWIAKQDEGRLLAAAGGVPIRRGVPEPSKRQTSASVAFSSSDVVEWGWMTGCGSGSSTASRCSSENGAPIAVDNVVIQQVVVTESNIVDVAGFPVSRGRSSPARGRRGSCATVG